MPIDQDLDPLKLGLVDASARTAEMQWVEAVPGQAYAKVLWTGPESGGWSALVRWKKGYAGPAHKHLAAAHSFILSGSLQIENAVYVTGDYVYEPNGVIHNVSKALEDTEFFFVSCGTILFFDREEFTHYMGWEEAGVLAGRGPGSFGRL